MTKLTNPNLTPEEMREHFLRLARRHHVRVQWATGARDMRDNPLLSGAGVAIIHGQQYPMVRVAPIDSVFVYITGLHELGHCIAPGGNTPHPSVEDRTPEDAMRRIRCEQKAWRWARRHALDWPPEAEQFMHQCFGSYRMWAARFGVRV